jgi:hypothetical protein
MIIKQPIYDGALIHDRFAYKFFQKDTSPVGNIVAFTAPMYVSENLIDLEDSITNDYIFSDNAVNFCWEIPNLCPIGAVSFQRWFNANVATLLQQYISKPIQLKGDDLMVVDNFVGSDQKVQEIGKVSVSITYSKDNVSIGHTGINIEAGEKAPGFAYSSKLSPEQQEKFMVDVCNMFNEEVLDITLATSKIIV